MQQFFEFPVSSVFTFDSFVVCDGNAGALQFSRRLADPHDPENLLYIYGPAGSGKSHLLQSIGMVMGAHGSGAIPYLSFREPVTAAELSCRFDQAEALIVDDLHLMPDDGGMRAALWQVFNDFHSSGRKIVMAGLHAPRELPFLDDHLVSRLLWGLVARVDVSDDHSRRMILKKIAGDRQVRIPDDVVDFILMTTSREVGDLISAFDSVFRLSMVLKRRITLPLAREARENKLPGDCP
jgi:chromosomal replication initiator protein